jgi:glutaminyl-peptide cyclotransferase
VSVREVGVREVGVREAAGTVMRVIAAIVVPLAFAVSGCGSQDAETPARAGPGPASDAATGERCRREPPVTLEAEVVRTIPHDVTAFTQGLVVHDGVLYESTGLVGKSTLRALDPATGRERQRAELPAEVFGEGLAVGADGRLVQLTWKDGVAYEWATETFQVERTFRYEGEGWGLTTLDDGTLVMSDGSDTLVERDPEDFGMVDSYRIDRVGGAADRLNELEWDGRSLWANRYQSTEILRIDPSCRSVTGVVDVQRLLDDATDERPAGAGPVGVANGIAHLPGTDRYLLTGKNWPTMYEVVLAPSDEARR